MKPKNSNLSEQYAEYNQLNLPEIDREILDYWKAHDIFAKSISTRKDAESYIFYEGPPSVNAMPGIHHVMGRTIKDIFARYWTLRGYRVERKGGWDTHGLPIELNVEKTLGITKKDIGVKISVEEYNQVCREEVLKYKDKWDEITQQMGYWVDLEHPYITYTNEYIESLWALLKRLYEKDYLYKGYTIQPFSPAAGTQLSSHELNQPGCYRMVKDTSAVAQFKIKDTDNDYFLAWTTTPWTLPSNTALAVGAEIVYVKVKTFNPYTALPVNVILAKDLLGKYFKEEHKDVPFESFHGGMKELPWEIIAEMNGFDLAGMRYEQLLPYAQPEEGDSFVVITGDFVTTEDGTGIVHIAPSFGADDMRVARQNNIGALTLVNKQGRFVDEVSDFAGMPVKDYDDDPDYESVDVKISIKLKQENKAFKVEKYEHSYPHCWRTDKPIIYYPLESWFIRTTAVKERMVELNKTINWKPKSTGEGRFGQWLENVIDWNLSRSRFWGTPLPIWREIGGLEERCIGSIAELREEVKKAVSAGFMEKELAEDFDLHKPYVDSVFLVSSSGKKMQREEDLIDVWFDSGAMPYAQWHYPFENIGKIEGKGEAFPADFIAEGVDQTRGWFYTLHVLSTMLFDSVAYKNVVSNGLVLDKNGNKMSKRLGNAVDPFSTIAKYGADATRWYLISNAQPWDNLKFDLDGIGEVQRKFFGTLYNTYSFFSLYANIDGFIPDDKKSIPVDQRSELDKWIISKLHSLIEQVSKDYEDYEPTRVARAIENFTDEHLSNWYVRLSRRRFWKGEMNEDKQAAYETLHECLLVISQLMSPIAPFFSEWLYLNLAKPSAGNAAVLNSESVHIMHLLKAKKENIDLLLEERMQMAQDITSMVLSLRKREKIKVRQPLSRILIPVLEASRKEQLLKVESYIRNEVNVKEIEYVTDTDGMVTKKIKPDFKKLGPKFGGKMKTAAAIIQGFSQSQISELEKNKSIGIEVDGNAAVIDIAEVEILSEDIPGWIVSNMNDLTVALDVNLSEELIAEGHAREFVNRVQNLRKDKDFNVTDRIRVEISRDAVLSKALNSYKSYICSEVLAQDIIETSELNSADEIDINDVRLKINIQVIN